ncbi:cysteine desulfurase family protein [Paenibacillus shirakamiensis]|uniref:cysteine desulfurase n=1 Tax=Paenibacillus shirakamiensis TaxID=1265935 RepID=A0ABS4JNZ0_9BACL|nr:cysteine desulfurase family protein [Paenibacillus shirakamiensis]
MIYLDHAATSWPKPPEVIEAVQQALQGQMASPGRGNHGMALQAGRTIMKARIQLAKLLDVKNTSDIMFSSNTTSALNLAIKGILKPGDHVIATMVEHNSVRRPLEFLKRTIGIEVSYMELSTEGELSLENFQKTFQSNTRLVVCSHSSNLLGSILPISELARIAHLNGALILIDAAQTAGAYPIRIHEDKLDMVAFPGHKSLLGPQGTGALVLSPEIDLVPLLHGGTGSQSEELEQPNVRPDRYEAGTPNTPGIAGLLAGTSYVMNIGVNNIYQHEWALTQHIMQGLLDIPNISVLGPGLGAERTGIVAFNVKGRDAAEIAFHLDRNYQIAVRAGYHCSPLAHKTASTLSIGAVRASVGYSSTKEDADILIRAIQEMYKA